MLGTDLAIKEWGSEEGVDHKVILERLLKAGDQKMAEKAANFGTDTLRMAEKSLLLQLLDQAWKDHLLSLDHLRQGIGLRSYAQRDPLNEYKHEAFNLFEEMLVRVREAITGVLCHLEIRTGSPEDAEVQRKPQAMEEHHGENGAPARNQPVQNAPAGPINPEDPASWGKVRRNAPCPCGSGKKYKQCHGSIS